MSAIVSLKRPDAVYFLTDTARYTRDGVLQELGPKCAPVNGFAAVATVGSHAGGVLFRQELAARFAGFDALTEGIEAAAPEILELDRDLIENAGLYLYVAGWSTARRALTAWAMKVAASDDAAGDSTLDPEPSFVLKPLGAGPLNGLDSYPPLRPADVVTLGESGFPFGRLDKLDLDEVVDGLHVMEVLRRRRFKGLHWVGGGVQLTTITEHGIEQRPIHEWPEDQIGELIEPPAIDLATWRRTRRPTPSLAIAGETKLQRDMRERREAKQARRRSGR